MPTPCSPLKAASKTTAGPKQQLKGFPPCSRLTKKYGMHPSSGLRNFVKAGLMRNQFLRGRSVSRILFRDQASLMTIHLRVALPRSLKLPTRINEN